MKIEEIRPGHRIPDEFGTAIVDHVEVDDFRQDTGRETALYYNLLTHREDRPEGSKSATWRLVRPGATL